MPIEGHVNERLDYQEIPYLCVIKGNHDLAGMIIYVRLYHVISH